MDLKGVYTALVTPFDSVGQLNEEILRKILNFQIHNEVDGIVVLGTTGEDPTLTHVEKCRILQISVDIAHDQIPLIAGTGAPSTAETIENTLLAKEFGVDGALVITPFYNRPTQEGMYRHFKALVEAVDIPIIVYNNPSRTGQNLEPETLNRIAELPGIIGVKECNMGQLMEIIHLISIPRPDFRVMTGNDPEAIPFISLGGHGVISAVSNLFPQQLKQIVDAAIQGDFEKAKKLFYPLLPFFKAVFVESNPIPIKAAMEICGIQVGSCRSPLCDLSPKNEELLRKTLNHLKDTIDAKEDIYV